MNVCPYTLANKQKLCDKPTEQYVPLLTNPHPNIIYIEQMLCCRNYYGCGDIFGEFIKILVNVFCN